ncbi:MDR family MFS transporter [Ferroacidibacillus organovorans]|uniref:Disulfide bond formation protein DsbA n=1 Tax=Ferroacidibacillus organovorans TaxID=1765683 RepID=A0A101XSL7_9BACL|nr:MDR family MFS transporter [Ferroacidibacillus organovorans]KUO96802.1 disulfide bond formation protein DsbA [Ferroacidibacillus organovorans]
MRSTNRQSVTIAVMVATFLTAMDNTVVSTAMPTIVSDLGGIQLMSWVFAVYVLTTAATTPLFGKLSDLYGRKLVFTIGTTLFLVGSALSGASQTMVELILFRAFQGIGAGAVFPITLTIIGDLYQGEARARIQGLFSAVWGISGVVGPLIGGFFVDVLSWRWIFYINIPIGVASMILLWTFLHEKFEKKNHRIDILGALLFLVGISSLLFAILSGGQTIAWNSPVLLGLLAVSAVSLALFLFVESRAIEPMLPLSLFQLPGIAVANLASLFGSAVLIAMSVYIPLFVQGIMGQSATSAGLTLTPMSIGWPLGAAVGGRIMFRIGPRSTSVLGAFLLVLGCAWLTLLPIGTSQWPFLLIMVIVGFGFGFAFTAFTILVQSAVDWTMRGTSTGTNQFMRNIGQTLGIAFFGLLLNDTVAQKLMNKALIRVTHGSAGMLGRLLDPAVASHFPPSFVQMMRAVLYDGLHAVFITVIAVSIIMFLLTLFLPTTFPEQTQSQSPKASA